MKTTIYLTDTDHNFEKVNLVTRNGGYDEYRCKCGLEGKRYGLSDALKVTGKADLILKCPNAKPKEVTTAKRVRINGFTGASSSFANLTEGSEHDVVECPANYKTKYGSDVWVMGIGEAVRLLPNEYVKI